MKIRLISLIASVFVLFSCSKEQEPQPTDAFGFYEDLTTQIWVQDKAGNDLLDPENEHAIDASKIRISHLVNGEAIEYHDGYMDHPYGYVVAAPGRYSTDSTMGYCFMGLMLAAENREDVDKPVTYINWGNNDVDTIVSEVVVKNNGAYKSVYKVWCNGDLVWDMANLDTLGRSFILVK